MGLKKDASSSGSLLAATLRVNTSRWPLVMLTYAGAPTKQQMAEHLRDIEVSVLERRRHFAQVIDQRHGQSPDAAQRALIAAHQNQYNLAYASYCLGEAYVAPKSTRIAMQGVFWQATLPYPYVFVETVDEAVAWAEERLKARRLKV